MLTAKVIEMHQLTFPSLLTCSKPRSTEWILMTLASGEFLDMYIYGHCTCKALDVSIKSYREKWNVFHDG
jgi:hypothetical protein